MGLSPNRSQTGKKPPEKRVRLRDNRSPPEASGWSNCDPESQVAKNKGFASINPSQFKCAKLFVNLLRVKPGV